MGPPYLTGMANDEALSQLRIQEYYDDLSKLDIPLAHSRWYDIDVASLLNGISIIGYEVDSDSGASLLFLEKKRNPLLPWFRQNSSLSKKFDSLFY